MLQNCLLALFPWVHLGARLLWDPCSLLQTLQGCLFTDSSSSLPFQGVLLRLLFYKMFGFLKRPVVVTFHINLNIVALTGVGLLSRLWQLSYPRAVV
jgi:hypothetical protein